MLQFNWLNLKGTCFWVKRHNQPVQSSTGVEDHSVLLITYPCNVARDAASDSYCTHTVVLWHYVPAFLMKHRKNLRSFHRRSKWSNITP